MKRAIPIVLLAALVAALLVFLPKERKNRDLPPGRAAELAPAETSLFIELPDLARTLERWPKHGLARLLEEPACREFLANWDAFIAESETADENLATLRNFLKVDPAGFFVAYTSREVQVPSSTGSGMVERLKRNTLAGFPYRGKRSDVEKFVRILKDGLLRASPGAKSELWKHEGIDVEAISGATPLHIAFDANWVFLSTDRDELAGVIERHVGKAGAPASLAKDTAFQEDRSHGYADSDFTFWSRHGALPSGLSDAAAFIGITPGSFHYSAKLDGSLLRDRLFLHPKYPPTADPLENPPSLPTTAETREVGMLNVDLISPPHYWFAEIAGKAPALLLNVLHWVSINRAGTFGQQLLYHSYSPSGKGPNAREYYFAIEVRDSRKALAEFETQLGYGHQKPEYPAAGVAELWLVRWVAQKPEWHRGASQATFALSESHFIFASSLAALDHALTQLGTAPAREKRELPAPIATAPVRPGNALHFFSNSRAQLQRNYEHGRTRIMLEIANNFQFPKYFDAGKLPPLSSITKHFEPAVVSLGAEGKGWLAEGAGTIPICSAYFAAWSPAFSRTVLSLRLSPAPLWILGLNDQDPGRLNGLSLHIISMKLRQYRKRHGAFPTTAQGLAALASHPTIAPIPEEWTPLLPFIPADPWGHPFHYRRPENPDETVFELVSSGADGVAGTDDDLRAEAPE